MNNLQKRKRAFMSLITRPLGFVRSVSGTLPLSLPYAMEGKADKYTIEGKSVQGKNLINYPYAIGNSGTTNGIDYTVNADGSIILNGTATAATYLSFNIGTSLVKLTPGETYTLSGCPAGGSSSTYYMVIQSNPETGHTVPADVGKGVSFVAQKNSYRIYIFVATNVTVENLTFYPQLEKGSTVTVWQSPVPSPDNPIEIKSVGEYNADTGKYKLNVVNRGVNLLTFPYTTSVGIGGGLVKPTTKNGITYTPHEDGSITIDGTSTAAYSVYIWGDKTSLIPGLKVGDTITISKNPDDLSQHANVYFVCNYYDSEGTMRSGAMTSNATTNTKVITEDWVGIGAYIHVPKEKTLNNLTIKPQIQIGSAATDYEPYREPITTSIFIDEPLRGIGEYRDRIDFESGIIERQIKVLDDLSSYNWTKNAEYLDYKSIYLACSVVGMNNINDGVVLSNNFQKAKWSNIQNTEGNYIWKATTSFGFRLHKDYMPGYDDLTSAKQLQTFKNWLTTNNVIIEFPLAEPITSELNLPDLPLFEGTNILSIEGDIQPDMTVIYKASVKEV